MRRPEPSAAKEAPSLSSSVYDGRVDMSYGGWIGAINGVAVGLHAAIDGKPTWILAGPIFWQGPCPNGAATCGDVWSIMELWSDPGLEDEDHTLLDTISSTFRNDVPIGG